MSEPRFRGYEPLSCPPPVDRQPRIIICAVQVPFVSGGAESHIESLRRELVRRDYLVDIVKLPFRWHPVRQMINDAVAWRLLDLTQSYGLPIDLAIVTRFPSYCVRHPRKVAWVLHQHRQAYDFLNTQYSDFTDLPDDDEVRKILYDIDSKSLKECRRIYANSQNVVDRMHRYLDIDSTPLYHPPPLTGRYHTMAYGDYIFTASRLELNKRIDLLIRAMAKTRHPVRAIVAGSGPMEKTLIGMASEMGIGDRIVFKGFISDEELLDQYSRCGAVWYAPLDEDYGYVTLEAFLSGKPVITASDSGGVLEFVEHQMTGYIGQPDPDALAIEIDRWYENRQSDPEFGRRARARAELITWDSVIRELTADLRLDSDRNCSRSGETSVES
ncbi:glycosyltransferase [bacterium]|nr:glycosyltransferase [candidate division CSSED10-310 bacterium]